MAQPMMQPMIQPMMQPLMMQPMAQPLVQPMVQPLVQPMVQPLVQPMVPGNLPLNLQYSGGVQNIVSPVGLVSPVMGTTTKPGFPTSTSFEGSKPNTPDSAKTVLRASSVSSQQSP